MPCSASTNARSTCPRTLSSPGQLCQGFLVTSDRTRLTGRRRFESIAFPLDRTGLEKLLEELRQDPQAQSRFRGFYTGPLDPMDVLRWNFEPDADDDPDLEIPTLERVVFARAEAPEQRANQRAATARLRQLQDQSLAAERSLNDALRRYLTPDEPPRLWFQKLRDSRLTWFVAGMIVVGVLGATALVVVRVTIPPSSLDIFDRPQSVHEAAIADILSIVESGTEGTVRVVFEDRNGTRVVLAWLNEKQVCITLHQWQTSSATACTLLEEFRWSGLSIGQEEDGSETEFRWGPAGFDAVMIKTLGTDEQQGAVTRKGVPATNLLTSRP